MIFVKSKCFIKLKSPHPKSNIDLTLCRWQNSFKKSIQDVEFEPLFTNNADVKGVIFKDPMGSMKPQYIRTPIIKTNLLDTKNNNYKDVGLSWIRDSHESREDLLSFKMSKYNEQRYEPRWTGNTSF